MDGQCNDFLLGLTESAKVMRRLLAADGYLDLGMTDHALRELEAIEDAGTLEAAVLFMEGEVYKAQHRYEDAIECLQGAAEMIPAPFDGPAWLSLSECFQERGQSELAEVARMFAEEPAMVAPEYRS